jgi:uncharacterized protein (DUF1501 family)
MTAKMQRDYEKVRRLLCKIAYNFKKGHNDPTETIEDLLSHANEVFVTTCLEHDEKRGKLTTILTIKLQSEFSRKYRKNCREGTRRKQLTEGIVAPVKMNAGATMKEVSEDAALVLKLALRPNLDMKVIIGKKDTYFRRKLALIQHLKDLGWRPWKIKKVFNEVRECL